MLSLHVAASSFVQIECGWNPNTNVCVACCLTSGNEWALCGRAECQMSWDSIPADCADDRIFCERCGGPCPPMQAASPPQPPAPPLPPQIPYVAVTSTVTVAVPADFQGFPEDVAWELTCGVGSLRSQTIGGAPFSADVTVAAGTSCSLLMVDAYGDGWEGLQWIGFGRQYSLDYGGEQIEVFAIDSPMPSAPPGVQVASPPPPPPVVELISGVKNAVKSLGRDGTAAIGDALETTLGHWSNLQQQEADGSGLSGSTSTATSFDYFSSAALGIAGSALEVGGGSHGEGVLNLTSKLARSASSLFLSSSGGGGGGALVGSVSTLAFVSPSIALRVVSTVGVSDGASGGSFSSASANASAYIASSVGSSNSSVYAAAAEPPMSPPPSRPPAPTTVGVPLSLARWVPRTRDATHLRSFSVNGTSPKTPRFGTTESIDALSLVLHAAHDGHT